MTCEALFKQFILEGYPPQKDIAAYEYKLMWRRTALTYMGSLHRTLQTRLGPEYPLEKQIWFNMGGSAISGDINYICMRKQREGIVEPGIGFHFFGNLDLCFFVIRSVKSMKDFIGGRNENLYKEACFDKELLLKRFEHYLRIK